VFSAVAHFFLRKAVLAWKAAYQSSRFSDVPRTGLSTRRLFSDQHGLQSHAPEASMSLLSQTQVFGLNFISAAISLACGTATIRGFTRTKTEKNRNFWPTW
jgi:K+-transporting ATPase A subunit